MYERIYRFNSKLSEKEMEICELEMDLKNVFVCTLINLSNNNIIPA